jgi:hypothetical protein
VREGVISAGDEIRRIANDDPKTITVAEFANIYRSKNSAGQRITSSMIRHMLEQGGIPDAFKSSLK